MAELFGNTISFSTFTSGNCSCDPLEDDDRCVGECYDEPEPCHCERYTSD